MERLRDFEGYESDDLIGISPVAQTGTTEDAQKRLLELQLKMASSSINHEYARIQFDEEKDRENREELLAYMDDCHRQYHSARKELSAYDPYALAEFEADLMRQKQSTIPHYSA